MSEPPSIAWGTAALKLLAGVALLVGLIAFIAPPWDVVRDTIALSIPMLLLSLLGSLLATIVTAARWKMLSEAMGATRLPYGVYFHWLALTRVVAQVLPTLVVDLLGRTAALKAAGSESRLGHLMAPVILERVLDLLLPVVLLGWAVAVHVQLVPIDPLASFAITVVVFGLIAIPLLGPLARAALRAWAWLAQRRGQAVDALPTTEVSPALSTRVVVLLVGRYLSIMIQYFGAAAGFGVVLPLLVLLSAAPAAQAAGLVGLTPGGLGIMEGGWAAALTSLGQSEAVVVVVMAATRVMMVVNFGLLSLASWPWRAAKGTVPGPR